MPRRYPAQHTGNGMGRLQQQGSLRTCLARAGKAWIELLYSIQQATSLFLIGVFSMDERKRRLEIQGWNTGWYTNEFCRPRPGGRRAAVGSGEHARAGRWRCRPLPRRKPSAASGRCASARRSPAAAIRPARPGPAPGAPRDRTGRGPGRSACPGWRRGVSASAVSTRGQVAGQAHHARQFLRQADAGVQGHGAALPRNRQARSSRSGCRGRSRARSVCGSRLPRRGMPWPSSTRTRSMTRMSYQERIAMPLLVVTRCRRVREHEAHGGAVGQVSAPGRWARSRCRRRPGHAAR